MTEHSGSAKLPSMDVSDGGTDFIDDAKLEALLRGGPADPGQVRDIIAKSMSKQALSVAETSVLLRADDASLIEEIKSAARTLKDKVYGNRVVLFAPLYIGNECVNDCSYCGFRRSNRDVARTTLSTGEIEQQVSALVDRGHKRLILVFGEHPRYSADVIAEATRTVYSVQRGPGSIRRININAAPLDVAGYRTVKEAGIGTYQVFQETYHHQAYSESHPKGTRKTNYPYRLDALSRAMEAGIDDVGIGALFGLADWRFEALGLVTHSLYLQDRYGVGPHTISFPRLQPAHGVSLDESKLVSDADLTRLIAILRLAVPYAGLICTAREPAAVRREALELGVSQIDGGSRIELGGYTMDGDQQVEKEQFSLGDLRSLDEVIGELIRVGHIPSFCTACYRVGRTGEHFMEFAIPGFIKEYCTPNGLLTLKEYLVDYASEDTRVAGEALIAREMDAIPESQLKATLAERLKRIAESDERDECF